MYKIFRLCKGRNVPSIVRATQSFSSMHTSIRRLFIFFLFHLIFYFSLYIISPAQSSSLASPYKDRNSPNVDWSKKSKDNKHTQYIYFATGIREKKTLFFLRTIIISLETLWIRLKIFRIKFFLFYHLETFKRKKKIVHWVVTVQAKDNHYYSCQIFFSFRFLSNKLHSSRHDEFKKKKKHY